MQIIAQGIVFAGTPHSQTASCCFPGLERLSDGTLLSYCCAGPEKHSPNGKILMSRSTDAGKSWSAPIKPFPDVFEGTPGNLSVCRCTDLGNQRVLATLMWFDRSDPALPVFNAETGGILPVKILFSNSTDNGLHWGPLWAMNDEPYGPLCSITGPTLILADGSWATHYELNKAYNDPNPWQQLAGLKISSDQGKTWSKAIEVARDPKCNIRYWDQRHALAPDGIWLAAFWTFDDEQAKDINFTISQTHDNGRTWSKPRDTGLAGQQPYPAFLADGRMAVTYIDRFDTRTIRVRLSLDKGRTFEDNDVIIYTQPVVKKDPGSVTLDTTEYLQQQSLWTFGIASGLPAPNGDLLVTYYAGDTQSTNTYWARLRFDD